MTVSPSPSSATTASDAIRIAAIYSGARLALALLGSTLALASPQNLADATETPATARQLITVEATTMWTTYATLRTWRRAGRCWLPAGGPYTARLGKNGLSANRREGDGRTPTGIYRIGRTMGRGPALADVQLLPARSLRDEAAGDAPVIAIGTTRQLRS